MKLVETDLPGCLIIEPQVFGDDRGFFFESFNHDKLAQHGLHPAFVQVKVFTPGVVQFAGVVTVPSFQMWAALSLCAWQQLYTFQCSSVLVCQSPNWPV